MAIFEHVVCLLSNGCYVALRGVSSKAGLWYLSMLQLEKVAQQQEILCNSKICVAAGKWGCFVLSNFQVRWCGAQQMCCKSNTV